MRTRRHDWQRKKWWAFRIKSSRNSVAPQVSQTRWFTLIPQRFSGWFHIDRRILIATLAGAAHTKALHQDEHQEEIKDKKVTHRNMVIAHAVGRHNQQPDHRYEPRYDQRPPSSLVIRP